MSISLLRRGKIELDGEEPLARRRLQRLQNILVSRVVGGHEHELRSCLQHLAGSLDRQDAPIVCQRMQDDRYVLARFDDLIEIADRTLANGTRQWTVDPLGIRRL